MRVELWVGVTQSGLMLMMRRGDESPARYNEIKGRELDVKNTSSPVKPEPLFSLYPHNPPNYRGNIGNKSGEIGNPGYILN